MSTVRNALHPVLKELIDRLEVNFIEPHVVVAKGFSLPTGCLGFYDFNYDILTVKKDNPPTDRYDCQNQVLCHELIHWSGAPNRLGRSTIWNYLRHGMIGAGAANYETEEAIAEMGGLMLAQELGIEEPDHAANSQRYLSKLPLANFEYAQQEARNAVQYILEKAYGYSSLTSDRKVA